MPNTIETQRTRTDAFSQLKRARKMLAEGRAELASARQDCPRQELIDLSAAAIRTSGKITQRRRPR